MLPGIAAAALARAAGSRASSSGRRRTFAMKFSSSSFSSSAAAPSMSPSTAAAPAFRASPALSRPSPALSMRPRHVPWSFSSIQLQRSVSVNSLVRENDEDTERPKIAAMMPIRGGDGGGRRRSNLNLNPNLHHHLHQASCRAFSAAANLPGENPASRDDAEAARALKSLGYRRDDDGRGNGTTPPLPLVGAKKGSTSTSSSPSYSSSTPESRADSAALARELHTVSVAIAANAAIFAAKACAYAVTGSSSMLAECVHSVVDTANQALLRLGVVRSRRPATALHPYGFMKDKFVWSLVSAVGIFCMGAGATVAHGLSALMDALAASNAIAAGGAAAAAAAAAAPEVTNLGVSAAVLTVSAIVESYSLLVATRAVAAGAAAANLTFGEYVRRGSDPTSVAVMLEDGAAVAGLAIAGLATAATAATGNVVWDATGSLAVGALLGATAVFLIQQNRSLLIGRAMNQNDTQRVLNLLSKDPAVSRVFDAKSEEIGPGVYRFKAEIEFNGDVVVQRARERSNLSGAQSPAARVRAALLKSSTTSTSSTSTSTSSSTSSTPPLVRDLNLNEEEAFDRNLTSALDDYGKELVGALGSEIDRIEASIRAFMPSIRHIDLEADKGSAGEHPLRHSMRDPS